MDFIANYWVILVVASILFLLVLLSYLIDKEIRKMKDDDSADVNNERIESKLNSNLDVYYDNNNDEINNIDKNIDNKEDEKEFVDDTSLPLEYDELDVEDIEDDFNKLIHKKKIIDTSIKDSIEAMKIDDLVISTEVNEEKIELPDIKIRKNKNEDIWKK